MTLFQFLLPIFRQQCILLLVCLMIGKIFCQPALAETLTEPAKKEKVFVIDECKESGIYIFKPATIYHARGAGQEFHFPDNPETVLIGRAGSTFNEAEDRRSAIIMNTGKVFLMTGEKEYFDLITHFGEVRMPESSFALVEYTPDGILRMENLLGKFLILTFRIGHHPYSITATKGEEVCIVADEGYKREQLVPADGVRREKMWSEHVPGCMVETNAFDQKMMVEQEELLACTPYNSESTIERIKYLKKRAKPLPSSRGMTPEPAVDCQLALAPRRLIIALR